MRVRRTPPLGTSCELARHDLGVLDEGLTRTRALLDGAVAADRILADHRDTTGVLRDVERRLGTATTPDELVTAIGLLASGRQRLATIEAYLVAETPRVGRFACFFDPSHGPSVTDTGWTTLRYGTRPVPVCLQDAALLAAGVRPDGRTVELGGRDVPYWEARETTATYLLGYFGGHHLLEWLGHRALRLSTRPSPPPSGGIKDSYG